jgi:hypothetical protein
VSAYKHKYHPDPRLSSSQLGEYLLASANRRRSIISDAKYPSALKTTFYDDARKAIVEQFAGRDHALNRADTAIVQKLQDTSLSAWARNNLKKSSEAINVFRNTVDKMGLHKIGFTIARKQASVLPIVGVRISVSLDLHARQVTRDGEERLGGAILVLSQTDSEMQARCEAVAVLVYRLVSAATPAVVDPSLCLAIDVFGGKVYRAKRQHKTLMKSIENSCNEVAAIWPRIAPPVGYDGPDVPGFARKAAHA